MRLHVIRSKHRRQRGGVLNLAATLRPLQALASSGPPGKLAPAVLLERSFYPLEIRCYILVLGFCKHARPT